MRKVWAWCKKLEKWTKARRLAHGKRSRRQWQETGILEIRGLMFYKIINKYFLYKSFLFWFLCVIQIWKQSKQWQTYIKKISGNQLLSRRDWRLGRGGERSALSNRNTRLTREYQGQQITTGATADEQITCSLWVFVFGCGVGSGVLGSKWVHWTHTTIDLLLYGSTAVNVCLYPDQNVYIIWC